MANCIVFYMYEWDIEYIIGFKKSEKYLYFGFLSNLLPYYKLQIKLSA